MRSKSRFTTFLLETGERIFRSGCDRFVRFRSALSPRATQTSLRRSPDSDRSSVGWSAPACLAYSFDHLKASCLVFVRLAHDRRFVGAVLLLVVLVVFVFIRISGRHAVAHDGEGAPVDPGGKLVVDIWYHVVAPRM